MTKLFTGNLELDSLGIYQELRNNLNPDDLQKLQKSYQISFLNRGCEEPELKRTSSNHNPKPARILSLLYHEAKVEDLEILIQGLLYYSIPEKKFDPTSSDNFLVKMAVALDTLRHLHMRFDKSPNKEITQNFKPLFMDNLKDDNRLVILARHAFNRCNATYCS